jgi:hypothetical protein
MTDTTKLTRFDRADDARDARALLSTVGSFNLFGLNDADSVNSTVNVSSTVIVEGTNNISATEEYLSVAGSFNAFYQEFVGSPIEFHEEKHRQFYLPPSLAKSAIASASGLAATFVVGFALSNDAKTQTTFTFREPLPSQLSSNVERLPSMLGMQQATAPSQASVEFSSLRAVRMPVRTSWPEAATLEPTVTSAAIQLPDLRDQARQSIANLGAAQGAPDDLSVAGDRTPTTQIEVPANTETLPTLPPESSVPPVNFDASHTPLAIAGISQSFVPQSIEAETETALIAGRSALQPLNVMRLQVNSSIAFRGYGTSAPEVLSEQIQHSSEETTLSQATSGLQKSDNSVGAQTSRLGKSHQASQGIRYFLDPSQQLLEVSETKLLPLTAHAKSEVAKADNIDAFRILRLPTSEYRRIWSMANTSSALPLPLPTHGFIDYQRKMIVVPAERPS